MTNQIFYTNWNDVPDNLATKTQLNKAGLKPAKNQPVVAYKTGSYSDYALYDRAHAIPKRTPTPAQLAALEKARQTIYTCDECGFDITKAQSPTCPDCRRAKSRRNRARHEARQWAQSALAQKTIIFDTETTGLNGEVIELAIIDIYGTLYHSRFNPITEIDPSATAVHGLNADMLANEPRWPDEVEAIAAVLSQAELIIAYNIEFDQDRIQHTCKIHSTADITLDRPFHCLMHEYAKFYGDYSAYFNDWRWQPLPGSNHDALSDCRAAFTLLAQMAEE